MLFTDEGNCHFALVTFEKDKGLQIALTARLTLLTQMVPEEWKLDISKTGGVEGEEWTDRLTLEELVDTLRGAASESDESDGESHLTTFNQMSSACRKRPKMTSSHEPTVKPDDSNHTLLEPAISKDHATKLNDSSHAQFEPAIPKDHATRSDNTNHTLLDTAISKDHTTKPNDPHLTQLKPSASHDDLTQPKDPNLTHFSVDLSNSDIRRFSRQLILPEIGVSGQIALRNVAVLVVGAGGLGCPAGVFLAAAGVGKIGIVDYDEVDISNLHRQIAHSEANVGVNKAESLAQGERERGRKRKVKRKRESG